MVTLRYLYAHMRAGKQRRTHPAHELPDPASTCDLPADFARKEDAETVRFIDVNGAQHNGFIRMRTNHEAGRKRKGLIWLLPASSAHSQRQRPQVLRTDAE